MRMFQFTFRVNNFKPWNLHLANAPRSHDINKTPNPLRYQSSVSASFGYSPSKHQSSFTLCSPPPAVPIPYSHPSAPTSWSQTKRVKVDRLGIILLTRKFYLIWKGINILHIKTIRLFSVSLHQTTRLDQRIPATFLRSKRYQDPTRTPRPFTGHFRTSKALAERRVLEDTKVLACFHRSARFRHQVSAKRPLWSCL